MTSFASAQRMLTWAGRAPQNHFKRAIADFREEVAAVVRDSKPVHRPGPGSCEAIHQLAVSRLREWGYAST